MEYGQFCPIAKSVELLGDKWTLLIVREMLMGGSRFNTLQRGLSSISPTVLTKRLNELVDNGLAVKKKIQGQKGYEYFLTESGKELFPIIEQLGVWGMRWSRNGMPDEDLDLELLMLYIERSIDPEKLVGNETVVRFHFTDMKKYPNWWLVVQGESIDTCVQDPGKEVDIYITTDLRTMIEAWMGDIGYKEAINSGRMKIIGPAALVRNPSNWIRNSLFHGIAPATEIRA